MHSGFKKILILSVILVFTLFSFLSLPLTSVEGEAWEDAYNLRKTDVEGKLGQVNSQVKTLNKNIGELRNEQLTLAAQVADIQSQITTTEKLIGETNVQIQKVEIEVEANNKQIVILKDQIKLVFVDIQSNQVSSIMEVLLSSKNLDEVLGKLSALDTLQTKLNVLRSQTQSKLDELTANKKLLVASNNTLQQTQALNNNRKEALNNLLEQTKGKEEQYQQIVANLNQQEKELQGQIASIDGEKKAEATRRAAEAERLRQNTGTRAAGTDPGGADYNSCNSVNEAVTLSGLPSTGSFALPSKDAFVTTGFGCPDASYPGNAHDGIDLSKYSALNSAIFAIDNGVVVYADRSGPWGKHIIIKHTYGNRRIYSLYAHLNTMAVGNGDYVTKGEQIGGMGTTGNSTGVHLHFVVMDETFETTFIPSCIKYFGAYTYCYDPFLSPFNFYN